MRTIILFLAVICMSALNAQDANFYSNISSDTTYFGNALELSFTLKNANGRNFQPPELKHFDLIGGPNQASSFSMINGQTSQELTYSYIINPVSAGKFEIGSGTIEVDGETLKTASITVVVLENPDGIEQPIQRMKPSQPFERSAPQKPKKKRKTYKI